MSFLNKIAIVTGASSGIGAATALKLIGEGAQAAIVGRNKEKLKLIAEKCEKIGPKPLTIIADVSKDEDAKRIVNETVEKFGKLDILVNNAGTANFTKLKADNAIEIFDKTMATNIRSVVNLTHLSIKHLTRTKGNIVNISSICGLTPMVMFAYCTSKAALDHFTRCAALELGPHGIRVNGINPGSVKTDIISNMGLPDEKAEAIWKNAIKNTILKRVADPEEIADLVAFLASDKGRSITGANIVSDNGAVLIGPH